MSSAPLDLNQKQRDRAVFTLLLVGYLLLILFPVLRADRYCYDDVVRALQGSYGWNNNGRILTNLMMRALELNASRVVDISPLPQILAAGVFAGIGVLIGRRYRIESPLAAALIAFPLGAQPFFLENISYRFDAACMATAILCALLPFLRSTSSGKDFGLSSLSVLACLNLYQPAVCVFFVFVVEEIWAGLYSSAAPREIASRFARRIAESSVAMTVYQLFFAGSIKDWVKQRGEIASFKDLPSVIATNAHGFSEFVIDAFAQRWLGVLGLLMLACLAFPAFIAWRFAWRNYKTGLGRSIALLCGILTLPAVALAVGGPMLFLREPLYMPRVMVGIGALLSVLLVAMNLCLRDRANGRAWQYGIGGAWALCFAVFASTYGNAAAAQKAYEASIATQLANDVSSLSIDHPIKNYLIEGSAGLAPQAEHASQQFPLLHKLLGSYLAEQDYFTRGYLVQYLPQLTDIREASNFDEAIFSRQVCEGSPAFVRNNFRLSLVDDTAVVSFVEPGAPDKCQAKPR